MSAHKRQSDNADVDYSYLRHTPQIDKTFNIPTIIATTIAFIVALGSGYAALSSRDVEISLLKQAQSEMRGIMISQAEHQRRTDEQQSREFRDWYTLLRTDLADIKRQLERVAEERNGRK